MITPDAQEEPVCWTDWTETKCVLDIVFNQEGRKSAVVMVAHDTREVVGEGNKKKGKLGPCGLSDWQVC